MKTEQFHVTAGDVEGSGPSSLPADAVGLVWAFGSTTRMESGDLYARLRRRFPRAVIAGCSTAGEILCQSIHDDSLVVTAVAFRHTEVRGVAQPIQIGRSSRETGRALAARLPADGLRHAFVLSDGLEVNGSELVDGLTEALPPGVTLTGGLAGDGAAFGRTLVLLDAPPAEGRVALLGFYGPRLRISHGCVGGWDPFGPERRITRSAGNVLYEMDGRSALDLYKRYLGEKARDLPASGLLFPLLVRRDAEDPGVVRTILSVDERTGGLTFAGDVPQNFLARMMKAGVDRLVDGAGQAAEQSLIPLQGHAPELALLISCVGRKLVLKQRAEEEVEAVRHVLGPATAVTGFYSYGEISPLTPDARCGLHNQTMTITTFSEPA